MLLTVSYYTNTGEQRYLRDREYNSQCQNEKWQKSSQRLCLILLDIYILKSLLPNLKQTKEIRLYLIMKRELPLLEYLSNHDDEYPAILIPVVPKLVDAI